MLLTSLQYPAAGHIVLHDSRGFSVGADNSATQAAAYVAAKLHAGCSEYRVAYAYLEFINTAAPDTEFTKPSFTPDMDGKQYYDSLQGNSEGRDFLRVPLAVPAEPTESSTGQVLPLVASSGDSSTGFWGHAFSSAANSRVYGLALVVSPKNTFSSDIVIARSYPVLPIAKVTNAAVVLSWSLGFAKAGI